MTLHEQIEEVCTRRTNGAFFAEAGLIRSLETVAAIAFREQWPESHDTRVVRHALKLFCRSGRPWIDPDEPGVD